ncbi:MAG: transglutaminase-like domain-containing protein [Clostridia bacterium]|nr:transglutaminase-like domain-containing protein [Clostridia bacterium]
MSSCGYQWHDFDTYAKWLKENNDFDYAESLDLDEPYSIGREFCLQIAEKYNIAEIAGNGSTQEKTLNILKWVSDNIKHDGSQMINLDKRNGYTLLEYGFGTEKGMNCYCLALVMTDCMQALGIKARTVLLMPKEYNTGDNHVVTHVYLDEEKKWIMVDPSWNAYFSNKDGAIMDVFELRDAFANGEIASLNTDANYNGEEADENYYKQYMSKNLYWFEIMLWTDTFYCVPAGFDLTEWNVNNLKWRIKNGMKVDNEDELIEQYKQYKYVNLNKDDFLKP